MGSKNEARGIICDENSTIEVNSTNITKCQNSGIWCTNKSQAIVNGCSITYCGG